MNDTTNDGAGMKIVVAFRVMCAIFVFTVATNHLGGTMSRGWIWIDEEVEHEEHLVPRLNALAAEWSAITNEEESRRFRIQADIEDGNDYDFDEEESYTRADWEREQREHFETVQARLEVIETLLERYGARMMRPYEHWNEDERYMEYQETRYDYGY